MLQPVRRTRDRLEPTRGLRRRRGGASLAGCTTATLLARQGLSVALLERHAGRDAYKRVCTHFIQPCGTPTLQRLGLSDAIEAVGGVRNSLDIWSQAGWVVGRHHRPNGECAYGYTIRREKLDPMLRALAAETPGVDLLPGLTVKRLSSERGRINGLVAHGRDRSERGIRARLVVGADGRGSTVAGLAGVRPRTIENRRFLYYAYFRDLRLASAPAGQMWFAEPDMAYAYPCDDGLTLVACALRRDRLEAFKAAPESEFARVFANLPEAPALEGSERVSPLIGKLDMPNAHRPAAAAGVAFTGDAAMAADPMWAVGCGWALQSAEWLADHAGPALAGEGKLDRALSRYRRLHRRRLLAHHLACASYSSGRRLLPHERLFLSAGVYDPVTANRLAGFGERMIGVHDIFSPRSVVRALRARAVA